MMDTEWQNTYLADDIVELKPLTAADFQPLFEIASDPLIWEQHPANDRYLIDVFRKYFDDALVSRSAYLIADKLTGLVIGCTRYYEFTPDNSSISIGFTFLSRPFWGGAFNKSAKKLLLDNAFKYVDRVYFHIGINNIRSQTATMRIGAVKAGERQLDGESLHYEYVIEKKDWIKQRPFEL